MYFLAERIGPPLLARAGNCLPTGDALNLPFRWVALAWRFQYVSWSLPTSLFQGRKRLSYNCLIVVEEAASQRHRSHGEDRQNGDHTHYKTPHYAELRLPK